MMLTTMLTTMLRKSVRFPPGAVLLFAICASVSAAPAIIAIDTQASALERQAAREVRRYVYLRTGALLDIEEVSRLPASGNAIVIATKCRALGATFIDEPDARPLAAQQYNLRACANTASNKQYQYIIGGDDTGTLYGAYRLAEHLGVRFYAHGDVIPDERIPFVMPAVHENGRPLFSVRGIQPFHDFAEGPDWWNIDDYLAIIGQLPKLRMNFIGLHTYPDSHVGPEPTVWIGLPGEFDKKTGRVSTAYPASYHTTGRSGKYWWAYDPVPTSKFSAGAAGIFDRDDYGADVMCGESFARQSKDFGIDIPASKDTPAFASATSVAPVTSASKAPADATIDPSGSILVFNRTADLIGRAFAEARRLGVLTCVGTETPLTVPAAMRARLLKQNINPDDPAVIRQIYAAMFGRLGVTAPVDYYWLWTSEGWNGGNSHAIYEAAARDIKLALDALADVKSPMVLATCGWVLGPQHDRPALDRLLPPDSPISAINGMVGMHPIDRQFANLSDRPRWAIPWLEDDPNLLSPQFWAGRMRYDAADALRLGCTGLLGIHWRTKILAPNFSALAAAAWDQTCTPADFDTTRISPQTASGALGGRIITAARPVAGKNEKGEDCHAPHETARAGMTGYEILAPGGNYTLTFQFAELENKKPGERVFSVKLNGKTVIDRLDIAAEAGPNTVLTRTITGAGKNTIIADGRVLIEFVPHTGEPCVCVIDLTGNTEWGPTPFARRINCGGKPFETYEADDLGALPRPPKNRAMPVTGFFRDFARVNFGPEAASEIGGIFASVDGHNMPAASYWGAGPGDIPRNPEPWDKVAPRGAFVSKLEALRPKIRGAGNLERYDYWLNQFRALRLIGEIGCAAGALDKKMAELTALTLTDTAAATRRARAEALPLRLRLTELWNRLMTAELAGAGTPGEFGAIANLEQRTRAHAKFLILHDQTLEKLLGASLPDAAQPATTYAGPARIIVPTVRTSAAAGEQIDLRVILLAKTATPARATLRWRPLGRGEYKSAVLTHVTRGVHKVALPVLDAMTPAIEYYMEATLDGVPIRWPATGGNINQTVVLQ